MIHCFLKSITTIDADALVLKKTIITVLQNTINSTATSLYKISVNTIKQGPATRV